MNGRKVTRLQSTNTAQTKSTFLKVILLGQGGVGKSSLMTRFVSNEFQENNLHTIGVEFLNKDVVVKDSAYTLQIWDTAGQERFRSLRTPFYRGSDVCLLVFSLTDRKSFENLGYWQKEFLNYADVPMQDSFPFVILGNKCDDLANRAVEQAEIDQFVKGKENIEYFQTSAKLDENVQQAFVAAIEGYQKFDSKMQQAGESTVRQQTVDLDTVKNKNNSCKC